MGIKQNSAVHFRCLRQKASKGEGKSELSREKGTNRNRKAAKKKMRNKIQREEGKV